MHTVELSSVSRFYGQRDAVRAAMLADRADEVIMEFFEGMRRKTRLAALMVAMLVVHVFYRWWLAYGLGVA